MGADYFDHPVVRRDEGWTDHHYGCMIRSTFLPYEDGLSLFVARDDGTEMQIRSQQRAEAEGPIIDALDRYVAPAPHRL